MEATGGLQQGRSNLDFIVDFRKLHSNSASHAALSTDQDRYGLPQSKYTYISKEIIAKICQSICCMLRNDTVLNALLTDTSTSNLIKRPTESWFKVLNGSLDFHFKITAAIAVYCASRVGSLVQELHPVSLQHDVFGSALINAIKLGKLKIVKKLITYLRSSPITEAHGDTLVKNPLKEFPIYEAIQTSIKYSRDDVLPMLAKLIHRKFSGLQLRMSSPSGIWSIFAMVF
ncbi:hypothetical protein GGP41_000723 [Bipolaris sorokiniana]|uniref:Uncharacterized protein n=1 Tax=Cochliobolus sativus TaxID=45130 RepID=A0A8H6DXE6_COCSA|nr:hypothetical protein GGP41_000723 [Bipolaris sorokiniana]